MLRFSFNKLSLLDVIDSRPLVKIDKDGYTGKVTTTNLKLNNNIISSISTDNTFASPNNTTLSTQKAVKEYVDSHSFSPSDPLLLNEVSLSSNLDAGSQSFNINPRSITSPNSIINLGNGKYKITANNTTSNVILASAGTKIDVASGNQFNILNTADSSSISTGALKVSGGIGITKNVNIGGSLKLTGDTVTLPKNYAYPRYLVKDAHIIYTPSTSTYATTLTFPKTHSTDKLYWECLIPSGWKERTNITPRFIWSTSDARTDNIRICAPIEVKAEDERSFDLIRGTEEFIDLRTPGDTDIHVDDFREVNLEDKRTQTVLRGCFRRACDDSGDTYAGDFFLHSFYFVYTCDKIGI